MDVRSILHNSNLLSTSPWLRCLTLVVLVVILLVRPASAQESSVSESSTQWWNPTTWGEGDKTVRKSSYFSGANQKSGESKSWLSFPKSPWSGSDKPAATSSGPSVFSKVGNTTKQAWNETVDFLNPFDKQPAQPPQQGYQPPQQGYQPQNTTTKQGTGIFGWMWREETTETPASVNEFLRQERPRF